MRTATITRTTKETTITISLNLDQQSGIQIATGIGFLITCWMHLLNMVDLA